MSTGKLIVAAGAAALIASAAVGRQSTQAPSTIPGVKNTTTVELDDLIPGQPPLPPGRGSVAAPTGDPGTPGPTPIPLPSPALLGAAGLGLVIGLYRRRSVK